jgi:hypothetical protein
LRSRSKGLGILRPSPARSLLGEALNIFKKGHGRLPQKFVSAYRQATRTGVGPIRSAEIAGPLSDADPSVMRTSSWAPSCLSREPRKDRSRALNVGGRGPGVVSGRGLSSCWIWKTPSLSRKFLRAMPFCVGALAWPGPDGDELFAHNYRVVDFALRAASSAPSTVPLLSTCCAKRRVHSSNAARSVSE